VGRPRGGAHRGHPPRLALASRLRRMRNAEFGMRNGMTLSRGNAFSRRAAESAEQNPVNAECGRGFTTEE
jgi:hypothetical protein